MIQLINLATKLMIAFNALLSRMENSSQTLTKFI